METIGQRLKAWRTENGLSTVDIHNKTGLSTGGLSAYERDEKQIGSKTLLALWEEYNIDIAWILTGKREGNLTPEEQTLVDTFRGCNTIGQSLIQEQADAIRQKLPADPADQDQAAGVSASAIG